MSTLRFAKVVATLPVPLERDTLYLVRTGAGFDLFCSDATGAVAHALNGGGGPPPAPPRRVFRFNRPYVVGNVAAAALGTLALTANRVYYVPFVLTAPMVLEIMTFSITTAGAGQGSIGIYTNQPNAQNSDQPGGFIWVSSPFGVGTAGNQSIFVPDLHLNVGEVYWAALVANVAITVRALGVASIQTVLGRQPDATAAITHLHQVSANAVLPSAAAASLSEGVGSIPAIGLREVWPSTPPSFS